MDGVDVTTRMDRAILKVLGSSLEGARTKSVLGGDFAIAAMTSLEVTGQDGSPEVVELEWPVFVGPTGQFVYAPIDMTDIWAGAISECHVFRRTLDVQAVRNSTMDEVTSALTSFDSSNVLASLVGLMPLATRLQRGLVIDIVVTSMKFSDAVSDDIQRYLKNRYMKRVSCTLPILSQESLTDPTFLSKVAPLIQRFSEKKGPTATQVGGGLQGLMSVLGK